ncbi:MAG TPA: AAA family ATPase [Gemmatimonadales bacterium]
MSLLPSLELRCFGPPTARLDGREPPREVLWKKHLALLVYLALSPGRRRSRDHLLTLLWGDQPDGRARRNLNEAVLRLRKALGDDRLRSDAGALVLDDAGLEVDALRLSAVAATDPEAAAALAAGDFLEGFHVEDSSDFDDWMSGERRRFHALAASTLVAAGHRRLLLNRFADARDLAYRALKREPLSEPAVGLLMRACALDGDSATALAAYGEFAHCLERDTGERPSKALVGLADRIREQTWRPLGTGDPTIEPPLVGREPVHRDVFATVGDALGAGPRTLIISGPPGVGCSRLLAECARRVALDGALVAHTRPLESDQDAPWSTLRLLVRAGLGDAPGLIAAEPQAVSALSGLVPELGVKFAPRDVTDDADMADALASVLGAIAAERPLVLAIDDAHWADDSSLAALRSAVAGLRGVPVGLLLTVAEGVGDPPRELVRLQGDVGRSLPGLAVRLMPLADAEVRLLVDALAPWCRTDADRDRLARRIAMETGGYPLFAVTLLTSLHRATTLREDLVTWPPPQSTTDAPLPFSIPNMVRYALAARVGELDSKQQAILRVAAVCGQVLDPDLVAQVAECSRADVEDALPAFERRQFVQFDGRRYVFAAPIVAEVVRAECLTRGERRRVELRAIDALATRGDLESRALRVELLAHAAPDAAAFELGVVVAHDAVAAGAARVARRSRAAATRIAEQAGLDHARLDGLPSI